ncbi:AAA family ATPase [Eubacteriales bacterium OttesenSCG-928-K08]|nr:AAA family ATPase [Eubacteriales bacterium OttesenSCG-928-K08]
MKKADITKVSEVTREDVKWLWYPYIPYGKITILQGDPGDGKTTFILAVASLLTTGQPLPGCEGRTAPVNVIYQTAEDGIGDTIKPRLEATGADCERVLVINENGQALSLSDSRLEEAIVHTKAGLLVLDPLQAYIGGKVDMHRANEVRPAFKQLAAVAERTGCAIVAIGHMNKMSGVKGIYRGLGSIDIAAVARSVLVVGRDKENANIRIMAHLKSSLAPEGQAIAFELGTDSGFRWIGPYDVTPDELLNGFPFLDDRPGKLAQAEALIVELLQSGPLPYADLYERLAAQNIGRRTAESAKKLMGVQSFKKGAQWYWTLDGPAE